MSGEEEKNKRKALNDIFVFTAVLALVTALWFSGWQLIDSYVFTETTDETNSAVRGQFGDKFGAINALFAGFAFSGIIFTLLLQRRDLAETRNAMSHERFDNTFFQLLSLHIDITSKLSARSHQGLEAFQAFNEHFKQCDPDFPVFTALQKIPRDKVRAIKDERNVDQNIYSDLTAADVQNLIQSLEKGVGAFDNFLDSSLKMHEEKLIAAYIKSASQYIDYFSHYFRNLYHILKFIDESNLISENEKKSYSKFVRSQLSDIELVCIFYNSISKIGLPGREDMELGYPKMRKLIKKFDILQNMNPRSIVHPTHKSIFDNNGD